MIIQSVKRYIFFFTKKVVDKSLLKVRVTGEAFIMLLEGKHKVPFFLTALLVDDYCVN